MRIKWAHERDVFRIGYDMLQAIWKLRQFRKCLKTSKFLGISKMDGCFQVCQRGRINFPGTFEIFPNRLKILKFVSQFGNKLLVDDCAEVASDALIDQVVDKEVDQER